MEAELAEIWRFPVKSMLGETVSRAAIDGSGVYGDRLYALIDQQTGKVASAKLPHRWGALLTFSAICREESDGEVFIIAPDGERRTCREPHALQPWLSDALGRTVLLERSRPEGVEFDRADPDAVAQKGAAKAVASTSMPLAMAAPEGGFFDFAPIHVITRQTLEYLLTDRPGGPDGHHRFRANLILDIPGAEPFCENHWPGSELRIGSELILSILAPTPRCAVPTLAHGDAAADRRLTTEIAKLNTREVLDLGAFACLGAYAGIVRAGAVATGDRATINPASAG